MTIDLEEEVEFLRDQVYRLNSALAFHQSKSSKNENTGLFPSDGKSPDWLSDRRLLSPLVSEYDAHIKNLKKQLSVHEDEEKHFAKQIQKLIEENQRLTRDLKEQVQLQLDSLNGQTRDDAEDGRPAGSTGLKYQEIVDNLQEQLSICLREKDHVDHLLQDALAECDRLAAVTDRGLQPLVDNLELQCSRKIESYGRSIAALNTEVNRAKLQLNEKQHQLDIVVEENEALKKDLERLKTHLDRRTEELEINGSGNKDLQSLTQAQEEVIQMMTEKHRLLTSDFYGVVSEKERLSQTCAALQEKISLLESHHAGALEQLKSNVQLVENVLLEKDQAIIRVKQLEEETQMLKLSLEDLVAEAGEKTKREVEEIRNESTAKMKQMSDFVAEMEEELRVKTNQAERLKIRLGEEGRRDANGSSHYSPSEIQGDPSSSLEIIQTLRDELHSMELKRNEAKSHSDERNKEMTLLSSTHERQRESWRDKENKLNSYIEELILEMDKARADSVEMATEKESLQELVHRLRVEASALETRLSMRDSSALESLAEKEASARSRLELAAETHREAVQTLRDAISRKDKLVDELRKDLSTSRTEIETIQATMKSERDQWRQRLAQLNSDLREERGRKSEAESSLSGLETRFSAAEECRKTVEAEKAAAQKALLEKIDAEKALMKKIGEMDKDFQRLIVGDASGRRREEFGVRRNDRRSSTSKEKDFTRPFDNHVSKNPSASGSVTPEQLSAVKGEVDEDLKKMFRIEAEDKKRRKKIV